MQRIFQAFIDAVAEGFDTAALHDALADFAAAFDLPLFAYLSVQTSRNVAPCLVSNYAPEWTGRYLCRHYERLDPVITRASAGDDAFSWTCEAGVGGSRDQVRFFEEAAFFGIGRGFTIPIPVKGSGTRTAALTFAAQENAHSFQRSVDLHGTALQLGAIYFHKQLRRVLSSGRVVAGVMLTKREFECLHWAAHGKTTWEIGGILTISRRTAAFHLDNARAKLGVHSITEAVALLAASRRPE